MNEQCCGTCKYHRKDNSDWESDWECTCPLSDEYGDYTDYKYYCENWEARNYE